MPETVIPPREEMDFKAPRTGEVAERTELPYYLTPETNATLQHLLALPAQELKEKGLDNIVDLIFQLQEHARQNYEDELTKAPNRRAFEKQIEQEKGRERVPGKDTYVGMLDVDNFKKYNTYLSHIGGDRALQHLADQMRAVIDEQTRPHDFFGRYGGDEFVIVARDMKSEEDAIALGKRLIDQLAENWITLPISWIEEQKHGDMRQYVREVTERERNFVQSKIEQAVQSDQVGAAFAHLKERLARIDARLASVDSTEVLEVPLRVSLGLAKVEEDNDLLKAFKRSNLANNDVAKAKKDAGEDYTLATYAEWQKQEEKRTETNSHAVQSRVTEYDSYENMGG